ncbi:hypothetical protein EV659_1216 [Rhodothalassium salexigens DSM 2132]|uniref:Uncharacterized protein n=1 Tax=Rhodothalassium salexigens DSM 2132 TaxID=1188247 RepID=A0A4R2P3S5_RHOSA|nr:hypothetical protein [Rhodothalassium salexigens]MBB4212837.1 signal transduction histidine kinase [Rhodothalassium salexigens DSM 2132]MBK1640087.1 hypothetical protein [Rhodothalassium salexigens DSM 2132]TCP29353.1 hypothetical protein EV659_1216 [Rhodothalassium salexigens DSM 2132]
MLQTPTSIPNGNTHRVIHIQGEGYRADFDRVEDIAADALADARAAIEVLRGLPYDHFKPLQPRLERLADRVARRKALDDEFRTTCETLLRDLARIDPDDTTARSLDHAMRLLREALNTSHRIADLLAAERDIGRTRGFEG